MSVRVMTQVWSLDLPDSEKIVLLALADCANDEGHCWPGMKSLVKKCSKTDRTIQTAIKGLCDKGHLTRREMLGKGCNYTVHPRSDFTPEVISPPKPAASTPEAASGKPSRTVNSEAKASSSVGKVLIPVDWTAPPMAELPPRAQACARQWTSASYHTEAEAFLLYWRSERKMKADWDGTWANRVIARHSAIMRDQKFGNAPTDAAAKVELTAEWYRKQAEFYDRIQRRDDAAECRRKAAMLERAA